MADQTDVVDAPYMVLGYRLYRLGVVAKQTIGSPIQKVGHLRYRITGLFLIGSPGDEGVQMGIWQLFYGVGGHTSGAITHKEPDDIAVQSRHRPTNGSVLARQPMARSTAVGNIRLVAVGRRITIVLPRWLQATLYRCECDSRSLIVIRHFIQQVEFGVGSTV
jgi:hypothetical protein